MAPALFPHPTHPPARHRTESGPAAEETGSGLVSLHRAASPAGRRHLFSSSPPGCQARGASRPASPAPGPAGLS